MVQSKLDNVKIVLGQVAGEVVKLHFGVLKLMLRQHIATNLAMLHNISNHF